MDNKYHSFVVVTITVVTTVFFIFNRNDDYYGTILQWLQETEFKACDILFQFTLNFV